jgi:hypothetical protein
VSARAAALVWLAIGAAVWLGFFDLYVSRGAREYLQTQAEFELGRGPRPSMDVVMARAQSDGVVAASWLGGAVTLCGWTTIALLRRSRRPA